METIVGSGRGHFSDLEHRGVGCLYFILGSIGVLSNCLVMNVFIRENVVSAPKKVLHINLCFSNVLVCLGFPFAGLSSFRGKWLFETFGCQAYGVESYTAGYAALGFVIALCIERYCSVRYTEFYDSSSTMTWWMMALVVWITSLLWALFPLFGWSSYAPEASGVACGLNWLQKDTSHLTYGLCICLGSLFWYVVAAVCISGTKQEKPIVVTRGLEYEWLNNHQLRWICIGFLVFVIIGWGPYGMFMCWSMITDSTEVSSLAASLPPLFAKGCTALYPIGYLLSSEKIRDGVLGGYLDEPAKKEK
ncbi:visual pigment-like receptor peropsin [Mytilus galloprovincialis]|uniref:Visual pigment-like receptor peropsin n=1 Tax=Mytilus galloprovincialis TaxID=29158 RepID=A0A8B6BLU7_MYTGA|nr:visual pigment-like receptor peropsin [Mytilus galloprovincialis]